MNNEQHMFYVTDKMSMYFKWLTELSQFLKISSIYWRKLIHFGEPILQKSWNIWSPLLYSNFKYLMSRNSMSFIRCQSLSHDLVKFCLASQNFMPTFMDNGLSSPPNVHLCIIASLICRSHGASCNTYGH